MMHSPPKDSSALNFNLISFIAQIRKDLAQRFELKGTINRHRLLFWLVTTGWREYKAVLEDPAINKAFSTSGYGPSGCLTLLQFVVLSNRPDVGAAFPLPDNLEQFLHWFYSNGIAECGYDNFLNLDERKRVYSSHVKVDPCRAGNSAHQLRRVSRPFGVNVIGYAYGELGIGEDARMAARALAAVDVPVALVNFEPGLGIGQRDMSMKRYVTEEGEYAVNLICLTAEEMGRFYAERGGLQLAGRYNIGYWPWELSNWPNEWNSLLTLVDEIWVSTRHVYDALRHVCSKPLRLMPMTVEIPDWRALVSRAEMRARFKLPTQAKLFCFAFDLNSSIFRKNPAACIEAFLAAFPSSIYPPCSVGLVIKTHKPRCVNKEWRQLQEAAADDDRIHIIEETLSRRELLSLYKACDCFISLHRAEGFGRGIAEAIQLGLKVITTGYSGNLDFCTPDVADLVNYRLIPVLQNQYPYWEGQVWAEPDVRHAAELMRFFVASNPRKRTHRPLSRFSAASVGKNYKQRIEEIANANAVALAFPD